MEVSRPLADVTNRRPAAGHADVRKLSAQVTQLQAQAASADMRSNLMSTKVRERCAFRTADMRSNLRVLP